MQRVVQHRRVGPEVAAVGAGELQGERSCLGGGRCCGCCRCCELELKLLLEAASFRESARACVCEGQMLRVLQVLQVGAEAAVGGSKLQGERSCLGARGNTRVLQVLSRCRCRHRQVLQTGVRG